MGFTLTLNVIQQIITSILYIWYNLVCALLISEYAATIPAEISDMRLYQHMTGNILINVLLIECIC